MLEIHPEARRNFNEKGESLIKEVKECPIKKHKNSSNKFDPDIYVSHTVTEKEIIGDIKFQAVDYTGNIIESYFSYENKEYGIFGESYRKLILLAEQIQKLPSFNSTISIDKTKESIFEWLRDSYTKRTNNSLIDYIISKFNECIFEQEIWLPIANLCIQTEFQVGRIFFRTITPKLFDNWENQILKKNQNEELVKFLKDKRKLLQGMAVSVIKLMSERKRALEIALEETEKSLAMLRIFSPIALFPEITSFCTVKGKENIDSITSLVIKKGELICIDESIACKHATIWNLDKKSIVTILRSGLYNISILLKIEKKNKFQTTLQDSLLLYSRSTLSKEISDKLIYIMISLENLLLINDTEPVQQNISDRIAFYIGKSIDERKEIIRIIKECYGLRSSFLHHGNCIKDLDSLRSFMRYIWIFYIIVIKNYERYEDKVQFVDTIDNIKYS